MGRVAAPHGVWGAVRVQPYSADPARLLDHCDWWLRGSGGRDVWKQYRVVSGRSQAGMLVVRLAGIESREAAGALRGAAVGLRRDALPALAENEFYQADLIGMEVVNRSGEVLGAVTEFLESGAHPVLRVTGAGEERLIPWVPRYIDRVDAESGRIDVDWPWDY